ncbi:hypothetical protein ZWY2020_031661 [Hordeum vulgare]|nr:hypothetical protein ZWY2020_031661 [Hordeum vulgare]
MAAPQRDVVGGVPQLVGVTGEESGRHSEIDKWLGSSSFPPQRSPQPSPSEIQLDSAYRAAMGVSRCIHTDPEGGAQVCIVVWWS